MNTAVIDRFKKLNPSQWSAAYLRDMGLRLLIPMLGIAIFLGIWHLGAQQVNTSLGTFPGPVEVSQQWSNLIDEHRTERGRAAAFYERQDERNARILAENPDADIREREFRGRSTFFDQIFTSLKTVLAGFLLATAIAIPLGIIIGMSQTLYRGLNPIIQVLKPVSPLAWLPLITLVVSAVYVTDDPMFSRSFLVSMFTVTLCSLWPTMINTAVGVGSVQQDLQNVSKVLRLGFFTHVRKIVLPSAIPMMFAGLRLSLGIAWMVLIAAEMLAQNPGLGKFVWDEFQNGSSDSLSRICVAVLVIGVIGFLLDRSILLLQSWVNWDKSAVVR